MDDDRSGGLGRRAIGRWCALEADWQGSLVALAIAASVAFGVEIP
jgi:hypothetical protein